MPDRWAGRWRENGAVAVFALLALATLWRMTGRAIWIDEGMLLKNIVEMTHWAEAFVPLPYFDQAQPAVATFLHKAVTLWREDIAPMRAILAMVTAASVAFAVLVLTRERVPAWKQAMVIAAFTLLLGYFFTEIKHYSLEIAFSFFAIYVLHQNFRGAWPAVVAAPLLCLFSLIGFSTLIPAAVLAGVMMARDYLREGMAVAMRVSLTAAVSGVLLALNLVQIKHLTVFQLDQSVYRSGGFWMDAHQLVASAIGAQGGVALAAATVVAIAATLGARAHSFAGLLSASILGMALIVTIGKFAGVYPVLSSRHLVWGVPFSLVLVALLIGWGLRAEAPMPRFAAIAVVVLVLIEVARLGVRHVTGAFPEHAENNRLYAALAAQPAGEVGVYPAAQATLSYYLRLDPALRKHTYFADGDIASGRKTTFEERATHAFANISGRTRLYVISHLPPVFKETHGSPVHGQRMKLIEELVTATGCARSEIMSGRNVQLLRLDCRR